MAPMVGHKTTTANRCGLGVSAFLAAALILGFSGSAAQAGTLAQLQFPARLAGKIKAPIDLCVSTSRTAGCRAAIEGALASATTRGGPIRSRPLFESGAMRTETDQSDLQPQHALTVRFYTEPEWQRRAKTLSHEGLTLVRMAHGATHEFRIGITPKGLLGFSLKDSTE
jgi:hypothetical protein